eukprot:2543243-Prymnesium_polylepis.1
MKYASLVRGPARSGAHSQPAPHDCSSALSAALCRQPRRGRANGQSSSAGRRKSDTLTPSIRRGPTQDHSTPVRV